MANAAELLAALAGHCRVVVGEHGSVMASLFITGLLGSLTHCTGMCGPLVAAQSVECLGRQVPGHGADWRRLAGAALIPYQLGRATTYAGLAAILALPIGFAQFWRQFWWLAPLFLAVAAVLFALQALRSLGVTLIPVSSPPRQRGSTSLGQHAQTAGTGLRAADLVMGWARPLFRNPVGWRGYALGLMLGFLPCGLLYAAIAAAAATGDVLAAILSMLVFALGTFPISWAIGFGSVIAATRWRKAIGRFLPYLAVINAIFLFFLAYRYAIDA